MRMIVGILRVTCVLLFLGLIYLWGRSSGGQDRIGWSWIGPAGQTTMRTVDTGSGSIGLFIYDGGPDAMYVGRDGYYFQYTPASRNGGSVPEGFLGFRYKHQAGINPQGVWERWRKVMVPYALLVGLVAATRAVGAKMASDKSSSVGRSLPDLRLQSSRSASPLPRVRRWDLSGVDRANHDTSLLVNRREQPGRKRRSPLAVPSRTMAAPAQRPTAEAAGLPTLESELPCDTSCPTNRPLILAAPSVGTCWRSLLCCSR